jgi:CRP/FNR family cyclic AMP-dependent transcriptional regulator
MAKKRWFVFEEHHECEILGAAVKSQLADSAKWGRRRTYPRHSLIWMGEDRANRVFLLEAGSVRVSYVDEDGTEAVVQVVTPGEMFGELCFCSQSSGRHGVQARAVVSTQVIEATIENGIEGFALLKNAEFGANLVGTFCKKLMEAEGRLAVLSEHDGRRRMILALLCLDRKRGCRGVLTISHAELAAFAGMTRPHTTVIMTRLRGEGLVSYERGSVLRLNVNGLKRGSQQHS